MTQDLLITCEYGTTTYVAQELKLKKFPEPILSSPTTLIIPAISDKEALRAAYTLQTPTRIGLFLGDCALSLDTEESILALETLIGTLDVQDYFTEKDTFNVDCTRVGNHEYNSVDLSQAVGRLIKRYAKESLPYVPETDFKKPNLIFYLHAYDDKAWLCLDLIGYNADKRTYKIFNNPHSMKGSTAACLLMAAGWNPKKSILDPYSGGGELLIEAALFSTGRAHHFYEKNLICKKMPRFKELFTTLIPTLDEAIIVNEQKLCSFDAQLKNITAAKKNAKIAGVDKEITFSKLDLDWLDIKLEEKSIDCIVTQPIEASKHIKQEKALQLHRQLFEQAEHLLSKKGVVAFLCTKPEDLKNVSKHYAFTLTHEAIIHTGKLSQTILVFTKK